jgi:FlaA1/EpsC-like NDP-sugar epimerase
MIYLLKKYYPVRNVIFIFGEGMLIFFTIQLVYLLFSGWGIYKIDIYRDAIRAFAVTVAFQVCLYLFDLYNLSKINADIGDWFIGIIQSFGVGCIILAVIYYLFPSLVISTSIFWTSYVIICLCIVLWRLLYYNILKNRLFSIPVVVIGTGRLAVDIAKEVEGRSDSGFRIAAFFGCDNPEYNPNKAKVFFDFSTLCVF